MSLCQPCPSAGRSTPPAGGISPSMLVHFFHLSSTFMQDCLETFSLLLGLRSWRGARICPPALGGQVSLVGVVLVAVYVMATTEQGLVKVDISSVRFSHSAVSDSLRSHESQHARPPCPSPTPGVYQNSCPSRQWCHPTISSSVVLFSSCPIPPSIRVFSNESTLRMSWPKYWTFSFSISPSKEHPGLISFRMDWLDLLAVQGTLKSLLQHHSSKASIFGAQLSSQSNSHIHTWLLKKP